jgi:hypothetical protein
MAKRIVKKLANARERHRLTAEYLDWARASGSPDAVASALRDLARHERQVTALVLRSEMARVWPSAERLRTLVRDMVPALIFALTAASVTFLGHWDAGAVGLLDGLLAAFAYLYFTKDTGRLRL